MIYLTADGHVGTDSGAIMDHCGSIIPRYTSNMKDWLMIQGVIVD